MPGCCEADCRALCFSQTLLTGSCSDPCVRWWEVSVFLQSVREKFPIRLISKVPSWQEGTCKGLCFSLWQIFPQVQLGQTLLNVVGACRDLCPKSSLRGSHRALPPVLLLPPHPQTAWSDPVRIPGPLWPVTSTPFHRAC